MYRADTMAPSDPESPNPAGWHPRAGDWVEIRSASEILSTLDASGDTERMPFMPEMLRFAGRRFQVSASAHKTCDTANRTGGRRLPRAVHLADLRCDGSAHGGCQAECLLFWKTQWLRPVEGPQGVATGNGNPADGAGQGEAATLLAEKLSAHTGTMQPNGVMRYRCQALKLFDATHALAWWDVRQYWRDVRSGNVPASHALSTLFLSWIFHLRQLPIGFRFWVWLYGRLHQLIRGQPDPHMHGKVAAGEATPDERTGLKVGDVVEIRSKAEIEATCNAMKRNRGLQIDEEMTTYCGHRFKVTNRVERIINEQTGEMMEFKNPCIVLDGVVCKGEYSAKRLMCPRRITAYWREIWLRRVDDGTPPAGPAPGGEHG